jgi:hypothetical protein
VTYIYMDFGLDTGFIGYSPLTTLMITIYYGPLTSLHNYNLQSRALSLFHSYSLSVVHYTCTESSWSAVHLVLGYRLPTVDVPPRSNN